jgi:hypothetical protein
MAAIVDTWMLVGVFCWSTASSALQNWLLVASVTVGSEACRFLSACLKVA